MRNMLRKKRRPARNVSHIHTESFRYYVVVGCIALVGLTVLLRLGYWQVYRKDFLAAAAEQQHWTRTVLPAPRGTIYYSDETIMVGNQPGYTLYVDKSKAADSYLSIANAVAPVTVEIPPVIEEVTRSAELDAETESEVASPGATPTATPTPSNTPTPTPDPMIRTQAEVQRILGALDRENTVWSRVKPGLTADDREKLDNLGLAGFEYESETLRYYPESSRSAHLMGFVGLNDAGLPKGYFGLEGFYDRQLQGREGSVTQEKDASGNPIIWGGQRSLPESSGRDLITHIDRTIQYVAEEKLREGIKTHEALSGTVTIMDPKTGAVLAAAAWPAYEPELFRYYPNQRYANPVVAGAYEPGSTFKTLIMGAALNEGVVTPETTCACSGPEAIGGYVIRTWNNQYRPGSTMKQVIKHSDNIGMIFVSRQLGEEKMVEYLKAFGMGELTGIDLQDEAAPPLRKDWKEIDLATTSFGQGILVTPIQIVRAVGAIANDGWMMQPQVVDKIRDGDQVVDIEPVAVRQVISAEAANQVTGMMIEASMFGANKRTDLKYYRIAGKTGTAQIAVGGEYDESNYIASFVGFAPADDPKFVMLVTLQEPLNPSPYGAETAAPVWFSIAEELFMYLGVAPRK